MPTKKCNEGTNTVGTACWLHWLHSLDSRATMSNYLQIETEIQLSVSTEIARQGDESHETSRRHDEISASQAGEQAHIMGNER